jgi:hypothetical protein
VWVAYGSNRILCSKPLKHYIYNGQYTTKYNFIKYFSFVYLIFAYDVILRALFIKLVVNMYTLVDNCRLLGVIKKYLEFLNITLSIRYCSKYKHYHHQRNRLKKKYPMSLFSTLKTLSGLNSEIPIFFICLLVKRRCNSVNAQVFV